MSACWASHLYTREISGCVEKAGVGGHSTQVTFSYLYEVTGNQLRRSPLLTQSIFKKLVTQWLGQKLMTSVWAVSFRQRLQEILDASEATSLLPMWDLETSFVLLSLTLSLALLLSLFLSSAQSVAFWCLLSRALNLQSLLCFQCQKSTVHKFYFDYGELIRGLIHLRNMINLGLILLANQRNSEVWPFWEIRLFWGFCSFGIQLTWSKYRIG